MCQTIYLDFCVMALASGYGSRAICLLQKLPVGSFYACVTVGSFKKYLKR